MGSTFYGWLQGSAGEATRQGTDTSGIYAAISDGTLKYSMAMTKNDDGSTSVTVAITNLRNGRYQTLWHGKAGEDPDYPAMLLPQPKT